MKRFLIGVLMVVFAALTACAPAFGATPVADELSLQFWPEYNDNNVLVMQVVKYPESTPLPIEVKMVLPKGSSIIWAGEILGSETGQDPKAKTTVNQKDDYDEVVFTLTKSRTAQVEASWPGLKVNGRERTITLDWVQRYEAKKTSFFVKAPTKSSEVKTTPLSRSIGKDQDQLEVFSAEPLALAVGQKQAFNVTYKRDATGPSMQTAQAQSSGGGEGMGARKSSSPNATPFVVEAVFVGIAIVMVIRKRRRSPDLDEEMSDS